MQMNTLKRNTKRMTSRQRGRGGKRGKTAGRGTKGMLARAGYKRRPEMRDIIKRLPKLRGYAFNSFQKKVSVVSLDLLEKHFKAGSEVSPATLVAAGLVKKESGVLEIAWRESSGHVAMTGPVEFEREIELTAAMFAAP